MFIWTHGTLGVMCYFVSQIRIIRKLLPYFAKLKQSYKYCAKKVLPVFTVPFNSFVLTKTYRILQFFFFDIQ